MVHEDRAIIALMHQHRTKRVPCQIGSIDLLLRKRSSEVSSRSWTSRGWLWPPGRPRQRPTERPPKLIPTQKAALAPLIDERPVKAGCSDACWRSPMIHYLLLPSAL